jgi:hypothetical protein
MNARQKAWQGMNWIRPEKRLAIYLRDGLACVYCSASVESGTQLTLDHVRPHSKGGKNGATNLVTACKRCNDSRGARPLYEFCDAVAIYLDHGIESITIYEHVAKQRRAPIDVAAAKKLIAARGSVAKVLSNLKEI